MTDAIDLQTLLVSRSPDIASWAPTVAITRVSCTAAGGFVLTFDRAIPDAWKWPSNPADPSQNFQYTVGMAAQRGGQWVGAGFVQMWQGRPMGDRSIPPIFADVDGAPGYTRLWGDVRHLWPGLDDYVPQPGDTLALFVTAGNARLTTGVTSVAERSTVVLFPLHADDSGDVAYGQDPPPPPPPDGHATIDTVLARLVLMESAAQQRETAAEQRHAIILAALQALQGRSYTGSAVIPYLGTAPITLAPK